MGVYFLSRQINTSPGFAYENRIHWLCGPAYANLAGVRAAISEFQARGFAYENRIHWLCGPAYANRAGVRAAFSEFQARGFAYENRIHWLCGPAYANRAGVRAALSEFQALGFAYKNRIHWLCGQTYANRAGVRAAYIIKPKSSPGLTVRLLFVMYIYFKVKKLIVPARRLLRRKIRPVHTV